MFAEIVGGLAANSLSLVADAAHMVTDALAMALALAAILIASRASSARLTYGFYRAEVLAAGLNALGLWLVAGWIFYEAYRRFLSPEDIGGGLTLTIGAVGLIVNVIAAMILRRPARESMNVEAAFLHVVGDLLGSVGVILAGALVIGLGWKLADPIFGVVIGILVLVTSTRLALRVLRVLMEASPTRINVPEICATLEAVDGVAGVHDIHVTSVKPSFDVLSGHIIVEAAKSHDGQRILRDLRDIASRQYGIQHVTIQLEADASTCAERHHRPH